MSLPVRIVSGRSINGVPEGSAIGTAANPIFTTGGPTTPGGTEGAGTTAAPAVQVGLLRTVTTEFTRPADTTAYAALDVVGPAATANLTFAGLMRVTGGEGYITKARLMTSQSTNTARFRLHLYRSAPTAIADNAQMTILYANRTARIGAIDFPAMGTEGTGSDSAYSMDQTLRLAISSATTDVFGILETRDVFTPANAQTFFLALTCDLD